MCFPSPRSTPGTSITDRRRKTIIFIFVFLQVVFVFAVLQLGLKEHDQIRLRWDYFTFNNLTMTYQNTTTRRGEVTIGESNESISSSNVIITNMKNPGLIYHLTDDYGWLVDGCMIIGTRETSPSSGCFCRSGWSGPACSIPLIITQTASPQTDVNTLRLRSKPRRVIMALPFNHEMHLLEARLHEHGRVVDLFVVCESNYSYYGESKPLHLLTRLEKEPSYLRKYRHKLLVLYEDTFPDGGKRDGWVADHHSRRQISRRSLALITGKRPDDLFIINDADEVPRWELILFLKLHDGYKEPVGIRYRHSQYGFYQLSSHMTQVVVASSLLMLRLLYDDDAYQLRSGKKWDLQRAAQYQSATGEQIQPWRVGDGEMPGGWHCSWCLTPPDIKTKLISAINADFPRWGDYPEKLDETYIKRLVARGSYFDDKPNKGVRFVDEKSDPNFSPRYFLERKDDPEYAYLMRNVYAEELARLNVTT